MRFGLVGAATEAYEVLGMGWEERVTVQDVRGGYEEVDAMGGGGGSTGIGVTVE